MKEKKKKFNETRTNVDFTSSIKNHMKGVVTGVNHER